MTQEELVSDYITNNAKDVKKAYKELKGNTKLPSQQVFNTAIETMSPSDLQALATKAGMPEDYSPSANTPSVDEVPAVKGLKTLTHVSTQKDGTKVSIPYHNLKYIGRSDGKQANFQFEYGTSFVSVTPTVSMLALNRQKPFQIGDVFPIASGTNEKGELNIEFKPDFGCYFGRVLASAHSNLMKISNQRNQGSTKSDDIKLAMADDKNLTYEQAEKMWNEVNHANIMERFRKSSTSGVRTFDLD